MASVFLPATIHKKGFDKWLYILVDRLYCNLSATSKSEMYGVWYFEALPQDLSNNVLENTRWEVYFAYAENYSFINTVFSV